MPKRKTRKKDASIEALLARCEATLAGHDGPRLLCEKVREAWAADDMAGVASAMFCLGGFDGARLLLRDAMRAIKATARLREGAAKNCHLPEELDAALTRFDELVARGTKKAAAEKRVKEQTGISGRVLRYHRLKRDQERFDNL